MRLKYAVLLAAVAVSGVSAADWIKGALLAVAFVAVYALLVLVRPHKPCRRCGGTRRSKRWFGQFGKAGVCQKCQGAGRHQRFGAKHVHRFYRSVVGGTSLPNMPDMPEVTITKGARNVSDRWASVPEQRRQGDGQREHGRV